MTGSGEVQADAEVGTLSVPAWQLRWRAPELSLVLSERAAALAASRRDEIERLRAESLAVFALNRLDRGVLATERAVLALKAAEAGGQFELCWRLRIELAGCARAAGVPLTGFGVLRPILQAESASAEVRAGALVALTDCLVLIGRNKELTNALGEADQLYGEDRQLDGDTTLLCRALLRASAARQHRRWGDLKAAVESAKDGLSLLDQLTDKTADSGFVVATLALELVCALMDSEQVGAAIEAAAAVVDQPVRAPSAAAIGWLKLALATRIHLPAGRADVANDLLFDVADSAARHQLDPLLSESMLSLAHVHELAGRLSDALTCLRSAHAAERRRSRALYAVRAKLAEEFATAHRETSGVKEQLSALLRPVARKTQRPPETDDLTGLLNQRGFRRRLDAVVNGGHVDHALTLVLLDLDQESAAKLDEQVLRQVADRIRDTAPDKAAVGRVGGDELAVLLPHTTRDQAQRWAEELSSGVAPGLAVKMRTGVAEYRPGSGGDALLTDADRALSAAKVDVAPGPPAIDDEDSLADRASQVHRPDVLPRRRARRPEEQATGLSAAWAQAADRWRMRSTEPDTTIAAEPLEATTGTSLFSDGSGVADRRRPSAHNGLAAFFRNATDLPDSPVAEAKAPVPVVDEPKAEATGGRRRAENRSESADPTASSRHTTDDPNRPSLASLVELLAAAGTGGRRRAPESTPDEPTAEAVPTNSAPPAEGQTARRRRRAEPEEPTQEAVAESVQWKLGSHAGEGRTAETTILPVVPPLPEPVPSEPVLSDTPVSLTERVPSPAPEPEPSDSTFGQGRRSRSELADLLAEALVAFESTQQEEAAEAKANQEAARQEVARQEAVQRAAVRREAAEPPRRERYDWQVEPSGSRHRHSETEDEITIPGRGAEPPLLSDWALSEPIGLNSPAAKPDHSALTSWSPAAFGEEPAAEPDRSWSDWTWTPPDR